MNIYDKYKGMLPQKIINDVKDKAAKNKLKGDEIKKVLVRAQEEYQKGLADEFDIIFIILI